MGRLKVFLVIQWNEDCSLSLPLLVWRVSEIPRVSIWVSWPEMMTEIVLISRSCLLRFHLIQQVAACWVLHEIRQDPTSYPPGRRPSQDQKLLILVRGHLQDLAMQRKPWLTAALTAWGNSFSGPLGAEWHREMMLKGHSYTCAAVCIKFTAVPLLFLWWKHKQEWPLTSVSCRFSPRPISGPQAIKLSFIVFYECCNSVR